MIMSKKKAPISYAEMLEGMEMALPEISEPQYTDEQLLKELENICEEDENGIPSNKKTNDDLENSIEDDFEKDSDDDSIKVKKDNNKTNKIPQKSRQSKKDDSENDEKNYDAELDALEKEVEENERKHASKSESDSEKESESEKEPKSFQLNATVTIIPFKEAFDTFSTIFYNYLYSVDNLKASNQYFQHLRNLAPRIVKKQPISAMYFPKLTFPHSPPPEASWSNIQTKPLSEIKRSINAFKGDPIAKLKAQFSQLSTLAQTIAKAGDQENAKIVQKAAELTRQSILTLSKPPVLVKHIIYFNNPNVLSSIEPSEIQVTFKSVDQLQKVPARITLTLPGLASKFISEEITTPKAVLNDVKSCKKCRMNSLARNFSHQKAIVSLSSTSATYEFTLHKLFQEPSMLFTASINSTIIYGEIGIHQPLNGNIERRTSKEIYLSPLVIIPPCQYDPSPSQINHRVQLPKPENNSEE